LVAAAEEEENAYGSPCYKDRLPDAAVEEAEAGAEEMNTDLGACPGLGQRHTDWQMDQARKVALNRSDQMGQDIDYNRRYNGPAGLHRPTSGHIDVRLSSNNMHCITSGVPVYRDMAA